MPRRSGRALKRAGAFFLRRDDFSGLAAGAFMPVREGGHG